MTNDRCDKCLYYIGGLKCKAFPERIPESILLGKDNHNKPLPTQKNNIIFVSITKGGENEQQEAI